MNEKWESMVERLTEENIEKNVINTNLKYKSNIVIQQFENLFEEDFNFESKLCLDKTNKQIVEDFVTQIYYEYVYLNYFIHYEQYKYCAVVRDNIKLMKKYTIDIIQQRIKEPDITDEDIEELLDDNAKKVIEEINYLFNLSYISHI
jgi:hypothetical protein